MRLCAIALSLFTLCSDYAFSVGANGQSPAAHPNPNALNNGQITSKGPVNCAPGANCEATELSVTTAPGVQRPLWSKIAELPVTLTDIGAACDGSALIDKFWTALASDPRTLVIPNGANCRIGSTMTWPKGKLIRVEGSGKITTDKGVTVTNRARFEAPLHQVFFGSGAVVGMKDNRPEWWGAQNTYGHVDGRDDAPAFNAAMLSAKASFAADGITSDGDRPSIRFSGVYYACSQIDLYPSETINLGFYGSGSLNGGGTILTCPKFNTSNGTRPALIAVHGINSAAGSFTGSNIEFRDFKLTNTVGSGAQIGLSFVPEGAGHSLAGSLNPSLLENVAITSFPTNIKIQNSRLIKFDRVGLWGPRTARGLWITVSDQKSFTGDLEFRELLVALCDRSSTDNRVCAGITNVSITADGSYGTGAGNSMQLKGIRFQASFGNAEKAIDVQALNGAQIGDMWLLAGSQIDGFACNTINFSSGNNQGNTSGSLIDDFHITGTYNRGRNAGCPAINATATGSSKIRSLFITGNWFANQMDVVGRFYGVQGLHLDGNTIYDPLGSIQVAAFSLEQVTDFTANQNIMTRSQIGRATGTFLNMINVGAGSDYGSASLNVCNGVTVECVAKNGGSNVNYVGNISSAH